MKFRNRRSSSTQEYLQASPTRAAAGIGRRALLRLCLAPLVAAWAHPLRGSRAAAAPGVSYRRLERAVVIPLRHLVKPWKPFSFKAWSTRPSGETPDVLLNGIVLRLPDDDSPKPSLEAFCTTCPHEICQVDLVDETTHVRTAPAAKPEHPLLVCPCHFSVFDPAAAGAVLAGPAHRGLYRFEQEIAHDHVRIVAIEEAALR